MILHKSWSYHTILELSFHIRQRVTLMKFMNSETVKQALVEAIIHLGQCVPQLITTLVDNYDEKTPLRFRKNRHQIWLLKDGSQWHRHMELLLYATTISQSRKHWRHWGSGSKLPTYGMVRVANFLLRSIKNSKECYWCTITLGKPTIETLWETFESRSDVKTMAQANGSSYIQIFCWSLFRWLHHCNKQPVPVTH